MATGITPPSASPFLAPARSASRLRWGLALVAVLLIWLLPGGIVSFVLMERWQSTLSTGNPRLFFVAVEAGFVVLAGALLLAHALLLRTPLSTLWACERPFLWLRSLQALVLWLALMTLATGLEALLFPGQIRFTGFVPDWPAWVLTILLLTPIQVAAEELFFRSLLLRFYWRLGASPPLALLLSALAFVAVHAPLIPLHLARSWLILAFYFSFACLAGGLVLTDQGLERVLGWHLGHNFFALLVLGHAEQGLRTPALFQTELTDPLWPLLQFLLLSLIGYGILRTDSLKGKSA